MEWATLREEIAARAGEIGDLLRAAPSGATPVAGLEWSVGELGAHLVSVPRRYVRMISEPTPFPEQLSALNEAEILAVGTTDPQDLAGLLRSETAVLLDVLGDDGDGSVPFFGMQHTAAGVGGIMLGELLLHGLDLARSLGRPWVVRPDQAIAVTRGLAPVLPHSVDHDVAAHATGTYHLRLRGGDDWTFLVRDGQVTAEQRRPARADVHVSADPVAFLLVGYEREPRWKALLRGRMVGWGRKPWLATRFSRLFVET